jgi:hypothetical protein
MRMSAKGSDLVRSYLWNAARVAIMHNPAVRALYKRLRARGTRGDVALGHCMRKLLHLVFAVWTSGRPFDKNHYPWEQAMANASDDESQVKKKAARHKRDVLPVKKVVTAATSSVESPPASVNESVASMASTNLALPSPTSKPSVDYAYLREQITIEEVLRHLGCFSQLRGSGSQRRGPCPLHGSHRQRSRSFSVNLDKNVYQCFHPTCAAQGNALDLWAAARGLPIHDAALDLAQTFHLRINRNREDGTRKLNHKTR